MLFHNPLNDCLTFEKYEYWNVMVNLKMAPIHVKYVKIILFILTYMYMGLHGEIIKKKIVSWTL